MDDIQKKLEVKRALIKKYEHLAVIAGSKPKRHQLQTKANRYKRQATEMERLVK